MSRSAPSPGLQLIDLHPAPADMGQLVQQGMERSPRQLPAWLLYDAEGSRLFDAICSQPEYTLTRTETTLLEERADALAALAAGTPAIPCDCGSDECPPRDSVAEPAQVVIHVLADTAPGAGFDPVQGGLVDVYFSTLAASRRAASTHSLTQRVTTGPVASRPIAHPKNTDTRGSPSA